MRQSILTLIAFIACSPYMVAQVDMEADSTTVQSSEEITVLAPQNCAHVDREAVVLLMPQLADAIESVKKIVAEYDKELELMEEEYTSKFDNYMATRDAVTPQIRERREAELVTTREEIANFAKIAREEFATAENKALEGVYKKVDKMIEAIGQDYQYAYIFDVSQGANPTPFTYSGMESTDITPLLMELLGVTPPVATEEE